MILRHAGLFGQLFYVEPFADVLAYIGQRQMYTVVLHIGLRRGILQESRHQDVQDTTTLYLIAERTALIKFQVTNQRLVVVVRFRVRLLQLQEWVDKAQSPYQFQIARSRLYLHGIVPLVQYAHIAVHILVYMYIIM